MDLELGGRVALVTGGSRGLGMHCALSLAREGAHVAICGRTEKTLADTASRLREHGVRAAAVVGDVSQRSEIGRIHAEATSALGPIDILVNNAGGSLAPGGIAETTLGDLVDTFDLNLFGGYELSRLVIPHMKSQRWGRIINITSIWGREYGGNVSYMAAKAGLIGATKHAAISLAEHGILVNSIAPGSISHSGGGWEEFQRDNPAEVVSDFIDRNLPLGRFGWPEPVGDLVAFLSSDRAGLITGACIPVDGGQGITML